MSPEYEKVRAAIADRAKARHTFALAEICASLATATGMIDGVETVRLAGRMALLQLALVELRRFLEPMRSDTAEQVLRLVDHAKLPVALAPRHRERHAETVRIIREQLATCDPMELVNRAHDLRGRVFRICERQLDAGAPERADLAETALARIRALVPTLAGLEGQAVIARIRRLSLPIEVAAKAAELVTQLQLEALALDRVDEPRNPALEAAIVEDCANPAPYAVLGDFLQAHQHPRGELVALQLRAESDPAFQSTADAFLAAHADVLLGSLAAHQHTREHPARASFVWRRGFIDRLVLAFDEDGSGAADPTPLAHLLDRALVHPSGRFIRSVTVGLSRDNDATLDDLIERLARMPHLREIFLGDFDPFESQVSEYRIGDVAPLWRIPTLRELHLRGGVFTLGTISHPTLERAVFETAGLEEPSALAIATATWPKLRHLDLWYGDPHLGPADALTSVRVLLSRRDLPALSHLGLKNASFANELPPLLASSPLAPQLRELDLGHGTLSDLGVKGLIEHRAAFAKLESLDVSNNYLDEATLAALRTAFPTVISSEQRTAEPHHRYVALAE